MRHVLTLQESRKGAAVANGRKGAKARNLALSADERSEISRRGAEARWGRKKTDFVPRSVRWEWDRTGEENQNEQAN